MVAPSVLGAGTKKAAELWSGGNATVLPHFESPRPAAQGQGHPKKSPARGVIPPRGAPVPAEASLLLRHCCAGNGNAAPKT
jgi:hypothetical protein